MTTPSIAEIRHYEQRLLSAMLRSDLDELDALLAENLVFTNHIGAIMSKHDDLTAHRTGMVKVEAVAASEERIQMLDGAAIVSVLLDISGRFAGVAANGAFRFARVWAATQSGEWQVVTAHSTLVAERNHAAELKGAEGSVDS